MITRCSTTPGYQNTLHYALAANKEPTIQGSNLDQCWLDKGTQGILRAFELRGLLYRPKGDRQIKKCAHLMIAYSPRDPIDDESMKMIAEDFLTALDWKDGQYIIVNHGKGRFKENHNHRHQHIIVNRVKENGNLTRTVPSGILKTISDEIAQNWDLETMPTWRDYGFRGSHFAHKLWLTSLKENRPQQIRRYELQCHLWEHLNQPNHKVVDFLKEIEQPWLQVRFWDKNNVGQYDNGYELKQVEDRIRNGEQLGISYAMYDGKKHQLKPVKGSVVGQWATLQGIRGYLNYQEYYRNLKVPIALKQYMEWKQEIEHRQQYPELYDEPIEQGLIITNARDDIPVMTDFASHFLKQAQEIDEIDEATEMDNDSEIHELLQKQALERQRLLDEAQRNRTYKQSGKNKQSKGGLEL